MAYGKSWIDFEPPPDTLPQTWELSKLGNRNWFMKNFGRNPIFPFGSVLLAALWLFTATAQAATPGAAQVKKVVGKADFTDAKGGGQIKEGDILMQGATIITGAGSYVDLFLGVNGDSLRVEADSTLTLNKLDYTKGVETVINTELDVKKGAAVANVVKKLSKASKYEIKTPAGVAGIRGTVLRAGATRIVCLVGRVEFRPVAGGGFQLVIGGTAVSVGGTGVVKATSVETTGIARSACALTANTQAANVVAASVQQFTAALAGEAAAEAGKAGGNTAQAAAQAARAIVAELIREVQQAAASAPPEIRAAAQAAVAALQQRTEAIQTTAAATAAASAVVENGGNAQQAQQAARDAAQQSTTNQRLADQVGGQVGRTVENAIRQGGTATEIAENIVDSAPTAGPTGPVGPPTPNPNVDTNKDKAKTTEG